MAATKAKGGKSATRTVVDVVSRASQQVKVLTDSSFEVISQACDETKAIVESQQKMLKEGFEMWQQYNQSYYDFILEALRRNSEQLFVFQENLGEIAESNLKRAQELILDEQSLALDAAEVFQAQTHATSAQVAGLLVEV
jgi:hypothetical protein